MLKAPERDPDGSSASPIPAGGFFERYAKISRLAYPVPEHARWLPYTLGGITFVGFLLLFASGFVLQQFFDPSPQRAHDTVKRLAEVPGGAFVRALHYWAAQAVTLVLLLHLLRVFVTGAYKPPRILTWYLGLGLLLLAVFGSYFTGTILKWDQEAFDALAHYVEGLKWLGPLGTFLGSTAFVSLNTKLYASHVSILPLLLILFIAGHFYLVNAHNLSPLPFGRDSARASVPREAMTGKFLEHSKSIFRYSLAYFALVAIVAWMVPAPLGPPAGQETGPHVKPPWPFLWLYGAENLTGRIDTMMPALLVVVLLLAIVPLADRGPERNPFKRKGMMAAGSLVLSALVGLSLYAGIAPPQLHEHGPAGASQPQGHEGANEEPQRESTTPAPAIEDEGHQEDGHPH